MSVNVKGQLPKHIAIVGLGLMGASLAQALRSSGSYITGIDANPLTCEYAIENHVVDRAMTQFAVGIKEADLIILATPVRVILRLLNQLPQHRPDGCLVFDVGSTKTGICAAMDALPAQFEAIGGHPMCGKESSGIESADASMYQNQTFILCETARTTPRIAQVATTIIEHVDGHLMRLDPEIHDEYVAVISHLPFLLAASLLRRAAQAAGEDPNLWYVSASGFRDTGRLAGSDPRMILDILLTNKEAVLTQIASYQENLAEIAGFIESGDEIKIRQWLNQRNYEYDIYKSHKPNS